MATLYRNGEVYSPADPFATALLVEGDRVLFVGSDDAAEAAAFGADEVVDLQGALVVPGFVDAHVHATQTGLTLTGLDLSGVRTLADALAAVERHAATHPGIVLGHGWDETSWPERRPPTTAELDRAAGDRPVYLSRVDVHSAVASSALRAAVPGLENLVGHDADGALTRDAHHAVRGVALGSITAAQRAAAQRETRAHAARQGIVALHECGGPDVGGEGDFTALLALAAAEPGPDVFGYWGEWRSAAKARELGAVGAGGDLFVDGALGSHTAALAAPYADAPGTSGHLYLDAGEIAEHLVDCVTNGTQGGFHAIGDRALAAVAEGFAAAAATVGLDRLRIGRHRVEHALMLDPTLIRALVNHGAVASVQPAFDAAWGGPDGMYAQRLGTERAAGLHPFSGLAGVGVPLAFGSDAPVTPLDPWGTVRAAAFPHNPHHAISVRAAFAAHTRGGWRALGRDDGGMLVPGAVASFAVWDVEELVVQAPDDRVARWSTDPRAGVQGLPALSDGATPPRCLRTVVRGETVFTAE
ncbi:amidohydrolase [Cryptosporangium minutisporangium]|uniref:Amidohydrolase n=1 Tax=Cryptosporangium minutisporangium TaxID=113569 RepID=A0ABP6T8B5_9ACTN